eukprot:TRINITY_DN4231_c0_g1_i1.p1 TRINITY_DN4231_c0_g1~~TRINITY_DN4231_c0_g1_i1.p1  ORF type:complete len:265 (-),score=50.66 TRINITY_DN4231_c0_g1_i1:500-1294(-)
MPAISLKACAAEFVAMLLFVFLCAGSATGVAGDPGWVQQVSLTFGFAITCLAYTIGHISGGQINCAVTVGLMLQGLLDMPQGLANIGAQLAGSVMGAGLLAMVKHDKIDKTLSLGTNTLGDDVGVFNALVGEIMCTFLLMFVVLQTAVNPKSEGARALAPIPIGIAVYLAHSIMIPVDGCSINPTRSFGPALVASIRSASSDISIKPADAWKDHWIFWFGPMLGSSLAVGVYKLFEKMDAKELAEPPAEKIVISMENQTVKEME